MRYLKRSLRGWVARVCLETLEQRALLSAPFGIQTVVLGGDEADGTGGKTFGSFVQAASAATMGEDGSVALEAVADGRFGVWAGPPGCLDFYAWQGINVPTFGGPYGPLFDRVALTDSGHVGYQNSAGAKQGVWVDGPDGSTTLIAKTGDVAPGAGGATFASFYSLFNNGGKVAFLATLSRTGVGDGNSFGIWSGDARGVSRAVRQGQEFPEFGAGQVLYDLSTDFVGMDRNGNLAFGGALGVPTGQGTFGDIHNGIFILDGTGLHLVIANNTGGTVAAGTNGGYFIFSALAGFNRFEHLLFEATAIHEIPNQDSEVFSGTWFSDKSGVNQPVVLKGQDVPAADPPVAGLAGAKFQVGSGVAFKGVLADSGRVVFESSLTNAADPTINRGVFIWDQGTLKSVIYKGQQVPEAPAGVVFGSVVEGGFQANAEGEFAFMANLTGPGQGEFSTGLLAMDKQGVLHLITRTGDSIEVSPGVTQVVQEISLGNGNAYPGNRSGGGDGLASSLNDKGQIAFSIQSAQGGGVFVANLDSPAPATVGGVVFDDDNGNGILDANESGRAGVTVELNAISGPGPLQRTATTNDAGEYCFAGAAAGNYYVKFTPPSSSMFTLRNQGGNRLKDSDATSTGVTDTFAVAVGAVDLSRGAGLRPAVSIGDFVFDDRNRDGLQNTGEPGVAGAKVRLYRTNDAKAGNADDVLVGMQRTDVNGKYLFTGLSAGKYYLKFTAVTGTRFTKQNAGNDARDSDANAAGDTAVFIADGVASVDKSHDAGMYRPIDVTGMAFLDINGNGIRDARDFGEKKVAVRLLDSLGRMLDVVSTGADGKFWFKDVKPGTYQLSFDLTFTSNDYIISPGNRGGDDKLDSDVIQLTRNKRSGNTAKFKADFEPVEPFDATKSKFRYFFCGVTTK